MADSMTLRDYTTRVHPRRSVRNCREAVITAVRQPRILLSRVERWSPSICYEELIGAQCPLDEASVRLTNVKARGSFKNSGKTP